MLRRLLSYASGGSSKDVGRAILGGFLGVTLGAVGATTGGVGLALTGAVVGLGVPLLADAPGAVSGPLPNPKNFRKRDQLPDYLEREFPDNSNGCQTN